MNIIENINKKLVFDKDEICAGGENDIKDEGASIWIWSAKMALEKLEEFNQPFNQKFINNVWLFGNDLGDLVYFFGTGKDGFGLYRTSAGCLSFEHAEKISDTLTDFLVNGVGIDIATSL